MARPTRRKTRGLAVSFVSKTRVRRFLVVEKLKLPRGPVPAGFWQSLEDAVQAHIRERCARGQMALPLDVPQACPGKGTA